MPSLLAQLENANTITVRATAANARTAFGLTVLVFIGIGFMLVRLKRGFLKFVDTSLRHLA